MTSITMTTNASIQVLDTPGEKPLRKDAERNRRLILDAARELFAQRGLGVTLNDIAHHAGVGVGTVYRRFPDKTALIESLFEESFQEIADRLRAAVADPDPWHGLVTFLDGQFETQARDQGLKELITATPDGIARVSRLRDELLPLSDQLVARAKQSGMLREDVDPTDLAIVQIMIGSVLDAAREVEPEAWRRYLAIFLRGVSARPEELPPLPVGPIRNDQIPRVMTNHKLAARGTETGSTSRSG
ncbi:MAG TPA: TetR/AcrR family transcriptional regulator [Solirubrobacteraceae bacterium]|nr:TetR/AcrR family transcriptional regulator [Solirubrobacteraceae bacterium]